MRTLELNFCKIKIRVKGLRRIRVWIGEQCQLAQVSVVFLAAHQPFHRPMLNVLFLDRKLVSGSVHVILFFNGAWIGICHFTRYLASFGRLEMNVWKLPPILGGRMLHILSYLHRVCVRSTVERVCENYFWCYLLKVIYESWYLCNYYIGVAGELRSVQIRHLIEIDERKRQWNRWATILKGARLDL